MKSLIVAEYFPPTVGGIQTYIHQICSNMAKNEIVVLAPRKGNYRRFDEKQPFKIYRKNFFYDYPLFRCASNIILVFYHIIKIHRKENILLTHFSHTSLSCLPALILKKIFKKPYIVYCHGFDLLSLPNILTKLVLKNADALIANSEFTRNLILNLGVKKEKVFLVYPGVNLRKFNPYVNPHKVIERHGLHGKKVILTVSRLVDRKNHEIVIKSLPKVLERVQNIVYLIVGEGPAEQELRKLVSDLNLGNNVIFAEFVSDNDLPEYYNSCDVFVLPSKVGKRGDVEGFGIVYLEANACGKPVICGEIGGINASVIDGVTGLKVNPTNIDEIAEALVKLLTNNKLAITLGQNGRRRVIKQFDWAGVSRKIREIIRTVNNNKYYSSKGWGA